MIPEQPESISQISQTLRTGRRSITSLVRECLARIEKLNPALTAFVSVYEQSALETAERLDTELRTGQDRGELHGIPIALKDNIDCAGELTTACSAALRDNIANNDAECTRRLRAAGAIIMGKTNMHELAYGGIGEVSAAGAAHNPWDMQRNAGGSSSGSAVAVLSGMVPVALGTDTGGSVRIPAAACGIIGYKPTINSISTKGVLPLSWTLDHVGPLTRTIDDAAITAGALANSKSPLRMLRELSDETPATGSLSICVARFPGLELDATAGGAFGNALWALEKAGHHISHFDLQYAREAHASWMAVMYSEASSRYEELLLRRYNDFSLSIRTQLEAGRHIGGMTYLRAQRFRASYANYFARVSSHHDIICMPTLPTVAPLIGQDTVQLPSGVVSTQDAMTFSNLTGNMLGWPAITLPIGAGHGTLPAGITLLRPAGEDVQLLRDAKSIQKLI